MNKKKNPKSIGQLISSYLSGTTSGRYKDNKKTWIFINLTAIQWTKRQQDNLMLLEEMHPNVPVQT